MDSQFKILIGDRNGHVRDFLKRELAAEGYDVSLAQDGREVLASLTGSNPPDLLIMDLLLPFVDGLLILERLKEKECPVPVVIYSSLSEYEAEPIVKTACAFIEKEGETGRLKTALASILHQRYPARFSKAAAQASHA